MVLSSSSKAVCELKKDTGAELVKRTIKCNAPADIYEGYFRIGTTEVTIVDQHPSAGISSHTTIKQTITR